MGKIMAMIMERIKKVPLTMAVAAVVILVIVVVLVLAMNHAVKVTGGENDATASTKALNAGVLKALPFMNKDDYADTKRGLIAEGPSVIKDANGNVVWNLDAFAFLSAGKSPDTVNPSLWRMAQLNLAHGLFKVCDHIWQVRGFDLSNVSFVETRNGYIVIDPLVSVETAKAALDMLYKYVGRKPVVAVIYTHSHVDHWAGVKGVVSEADVRSGRVKIIAPVGFLEEAISENVTAGNAMARRAMYMYGNLLPKGPKGQVDAGLGKTISRGTITLIPPTDIISKTGTTMTVDGIKIVFQYTPNTEAPTEMNFYFPQYRALCMAENCTHTLHNLYTLRGAKVRDAKAWSDFLNEAIEMFGDRSDVMFASHHWPRWGNAKVVEMLTKQRDLYRYIHDQTLRLANEGHNMNECAEMVKLPDPLAKEWYNRGYYGTLSHDVKAVFQRYLGWFDGNPATLDPLPPVEESKKYVEYMGGASAVIEKAKKAYANGEYRWVAEVLNHVVFANPGNKEARKLEANALEQLGYQAESGVWRDFYLTGAKELREGVVKLPGTNSPPDVLRAMPLDMIFDYMALRLNGPKADGKKISVNWNFTDTGEKYLLTLEDSVLIHFAGRQSNSADATITLKRATLNEVFSGQAKLAGKLASGEIKIKGSKLKVIKLMSMLDTFDPNFKIMER